MKENNKKAKAYFVGGGIASLSGAAFLVRDVGFSPENIYIFDSSEKIGGCLDGQCSAISKKYIMRGVRMFEENVYTSTLDLFSFIPSLKNNSKTLKEEFFDFNTKIKLNSKSRLVKNKRVIDSRKLELSWKHRYDLLKILISSESSLEGLQIKDIFDDSFFETNFWFEVCTIFSFQPWHSLIEAKRYLLRFIQRLPYLNTLEGVLSTPYNQYDFMVLPLCGWLKEKGVNFVMDTSINDLDFSVKDGIRKVSNIYYEQKGERGNVVVNDDDLVFITIGSMVANSSLGSMDKSPDDVIDKKTHEWSLWENIAKKHCDFGRPAVFNSNINKSKWNSFTVTFYDSLFFDLMENFTGNEIGSEGLITFKDSNWLISIILPYQPHFIDQPENITVAWGYGLFPDKPGNFINKKMSDCNGREILTELCYHLGIDNEVNAIIENSNCIPCSMPYITSQFLPRKKGDRPLVIPPQTKNMAFLGQYCEIPEDIVFTVEYSVRSAQMAVYSLFDLDKKVAPIYRGAYYPNIFFGAIKTLFR